MSRLDVARTPGVKTGRTLDVGCQDWAYQGCRVSRLDVAGMLGNQRRPRPVVPSAAQERCVADDAMMWIKY